MSNFYNKIPKALKYLGFIIVGIICLFIFLANFSAVESRFKCPGEFVEVGAKQPVTMFIKITKYRWWVELWSDSNSDGNFWYEIPIMGVNYYSHVVEIGDQLHIYETEGGELKGNFSTLSKTLALSTHYGFFDGICEVID